MLEQTIRSQCVSFRNIWTPLMTTTTAHSWQEYFQMISSDHLLKLYLNELSLNFIILWRNIAMTSSFKLERKKQKTDINLTIRCTWIKCQPQHCFLGFKPLKSFLYGLQVFLWLFNFLIWNQITWLCNSPCCLQGCRWTATPAVPLPPMKNATETLRNVRRH